MNNIQLGYHNKCLNLLDHFTEWNSRLLAPTTEVNRASGRAIQIERPTPALGSQWKIKGATHKKRLRPAETADEFIWVQYPFNETQNKLAANKGFCVRDTRRAFKS